MITQLQFTRFRGHEGNFTFGPGKNIIKGPNESGKSTIKEAIAFAWMGTDSAGTKNPDHLISVGNDSLEVRLSTPKSTIIRRKKAKSTSDITIARPGMLDVKLSQTDLMNQLGISHEVFLSSWSVGYFMNLKSEARLKVLGEIAKINRKELLLEKLGPGISVPAQVKYSNPRIDAAAVADLRRAEQNKKQSFLASLETLRKQFMSLPSEVTNLNPEEVRGKIAEAEASLQEHVLHKQNLIKWMGENKKRSHARETLAKLEAKVGPLKHSLSFNETALIDVTDQRAKLTQTRASAEEELSKLQRSKREVDLPLPVKPNLIEGACPSCGAEIAASRVSGLLKMYEELVTKYNQHAREVADHNKRIDDQITEIERSVELWDMTHNNLTAEVYRITAEISKLKDELRYLDERISETMLIPFSLMPAPEEPDGNMEAIQEVRDRLKAELHAYNLWHTQRLSIEAQVAETEVLVQKHEEERARLEKVEKALLLLPELETSATLEKIAIPGIRMTLVDGELTVTDSEGVDYRCLSDGRRMKIDLALCLAIKKAEPKCPDWLFVDNADLMDEDVRVPPGIQVFIAQVDPSSKEVQVVAL